MAGCKFTFFTYILIASPDKYDTRVSTSLTVLLWCSWPCHGILWVLRKSLVYWQIWYICALPLPLPPLTYLWYLIYGRTLKFVSGWIPWTSPLWYVYLYVLISFIWFKTKMYSVQSSLWTMNLSKELLENPTIKLKLSNYT